MELYTIFSPKWKAHVQILHIHLAAMELPTLSCMAYDLRSSKVCSRYSTTIPHELDDYTERHPMVIHCLHPIFLQFTVQTECVMASRSCSNVNHQSTCSASSYPAFLFHQEPLFTTMVWAAFLLSEQKTSTVQRKTIFHWSVPLEGGRWMQQRVFA